MTHHSISIDQKYDQEIGFLGMAGWASKTRAQILIYQRGEF